MLMGVIQNTLNTRYWRNKWAVLVSPFNSITLKLSGIYVTDIPVTKEQSAARMWCYLTNKIPTSIITIYQQLALST